MMLRKQAVQHCLLTLASLFGTACRLFSTASAFVAPHRKLLPSALVEGGAPLQTPLALDFAADLRAGAHFSNLSLSRLVEINPLVVAKSWLSPFLLCRTWVALGGSPSLQRMGNKTPAFHLRATRDGMLASYIASATCSYNVDPT